MADDIILQVDPELLKRKSADITNKIGEIERAFGAIESRINATRGYWTGDSSEKYQVTGWQRHSIPLRWIMQMPNVR